MTAARALPADPPFPTDGRAHPEHPTRSDTQRAAHADEDQFDFGDACAREREVEHPTGLEADDAEFLGDVLDLNEATAPFVTMLDGEEPDTERNPEPWRPSEVTS